MPKDDNPINSLPEYEIRTMEDDINKLEGRPTDKKPVKLNLPPIQPAPQAKPEVIEKKEIPVETVKKEALPPEELPVVKELPAEKPEIKKAPLPSMEEFVAPIPAPAPIPKPTLAPVPKPSPIPRIKPIAPKAPKRITKTILIILIIILALIALGVFFYWQGTRPEPLPPPPPPTEEINIPASLIPADETKILKIESGMSFKNLLRDEIGLEQIPQTLKRIVAVKNKTEILSLNELSENLNIAIYPYVLSELKNNYTLVIYGQNSEKVIGLIVEANNPDKIKGQARFWETTMSEDLKNLFLFRKPGDPTTTFFRDNIYKNVAIRYINFPNPDLTIDYAIWNNLFIISTSRESMYNIIDRLVP